MYMYIRVCIYVYMYILRSKWARFIEVLESEYTVKLQGYSAVQRRRHSTILITLRDHLAWHFGKSFIEVQSISVARSFRSEAHRPAFEPVHRQRKRGWTIGFIYKLERQMARGRTMAVKAQVLGPGVAPSIYCR